jgi:cytochrome oxidase assembly protein ShyY1
MMNNQQEMWAILSDPPEKLAGLLTQIKDDQCLMQKFNSTSFIWNTLDINEVIRKFNIACIEYACTYLREAHATSKERYKLLYWSGLEATCQRVINGLNGLDDLAAARLDAYSFYGKAHNTSAASAGNPHLQYLATASGYLANAARAATLHCAQTVVITTGYAIAYYVAAPNPSYINVSYRRARSYLIDILIGIMLSEYENKRLTSGSHNAIVNL